MFLKNDNIWGTKQSHFVPSCLWTCLTTLEVLKSHFVPSCLWSCLTTIEELNSLSLSHRVCEVICRPLKLSHKHWGTKQSHIVPSCLWSCVTTIEVLNSLFSSHRVCEDIWPPLRYQTVSLCHIVFVKLSNNLWCTKQSHFVTSCFWSCLTTFEVLNSLTLFHRVCEVVLQPLMY